MKIVRVLILLMTVASTIAQAEDLKLPTKEEMQKRISELTPLQQKVTQDEGTEPPFKNEFWDNKKPGIYVDIVSGEPLFSSLEKYDSGTGWPSFYRPIEGAEIVERIDKKLLVPEQK